MDAAPHVCTTQSVVPNWLNLRGGGETTTMDVHGLYPRAITAQDLSPVRGGHDMSAIDHRLAILSCLFHVACRRVVFAGKKTVVVV